MIDRSIDLAWGRGFLQHLLRDSRRETGDDERLTPEGDSTFHALCKSG